MSWDQLLNAIVSFYLILLVITLISYLPRIRAWFYGFKKEKHIVNNIEIYEK